MISMSKQLNWALLAGILITSAQCKTADAIDEYTDELEFIRTGSVSIPDCGMIYIAEVSDPIWVVACSLSAELVQIDFSLQRQIFRLDLGFAPMVLHYGENGLYVFGTTVDETQGRIVLLDDSLDVIAEEAIVSSNGFTPTKAIVVHDSVIVNDISSNKLRSFDSRTLEFRETVFAGSGPIVDFDFQDETIFAADTLGRAIHVLPIVSGESRFSEGRKPSWVVDYSLSFSHDLESRPTSVDAHEDDLVIATEDAELMIFPLYKRQYYDVEHEYKRGAWGEQVRVPEVFKRVVFEVGEIIVAKKFSQEGVSDYYNFNWATLKVSGGTYSAWMARSAEVVRMDSSGGVTSFHIPPGTTDVKFVDPEIFLLTDPNREVVEKYELF